MNMGRPSVQMPLPLGSGGGARSPCRRGPCSARRASGVCPGRVRRAPDPMVTDSRGSATPPLPSRDPCRTTAC